MMPTLEELTLKMRCTEPIRDWPPGNLEGHARYSYSSVRKLTLELSCVNINLVGIKALFPNVSSLELSLCGSAHVPCRELWELWPNLQELNISGMDGILRQNYDAEFCGINEEEAELLREMDEECLRTVQVVPIRPSMLTMPNLHTISIDVKFRAPTAESSAENSLAFISKVTELVTLKRVLQGASSIKWSFESENDDEDREVEEDGFVGNEGESDEDDEEGDDDDDDSEDDIGE